ncbi:hypothetical protein [Sphingomonas oligophenolica]|uniref:Uncharacterized protein n=1 Tax=Sphingomonas oligophenolica TaxID=301154 RepID=A0A502C2W9_9SPHN|nr:hypothetical protein [Sphingomonas oligophenolica]TPG07497.1 hypothetical protein EAH84_14380 [Sphingomonas oligophenolica]
MLIAAPSALSASGKEDSMSQDEVRRKADRRQATTSQYGGDDRRIGERRQPVVEMTDAALQSAYRKTGGGGLRALALLAEIERRGLNT